MNNKANVDFVVGTQYGDEGKGMVAKLLADLAAENRKPYQWTARVGAQNAEHRFIHEACDFCARILPSASAFRDDIVAVLGAGHCFRPEQLKLEATHLGVPAERIFVDQNAMWLKDIHAERNLGVGNARGTTGWGIGDAIAEKVKRSPATQLVGDCRDLREWLGDNVGRASTFVDKMEGPGLFESSQGCMLSLNHGRYPWSTAKDVTVPAMCAELGISTKRVRKITGVARLVFMRVPGPSGPTGGEEVTYDEIERETDLRFHHHKRLQGDTTRWQATTGSGVAEEERLFRFSMEELEYSHHLNGYDQLVVTFADMHRKGNYRVTEWDQLHKDTRAEITRIEKALKVPVVLVRTGQGEHDNVWRI